LSLSISTPTWLRRLGAMLLYAALLLAQQQLRVHPLSHLDAAAAALPDPALDPPAEHAADACALCLACAATESLALAAATPAPTVAALQLPAAALAGAAALWAEAALHCIRGPPARATELG
jgi:hypothetical protein